MREFKSAATPEVLEYLARHARQDEVLARVERETAGMPRAGMQVSVDQGALLTLLTKLVGTRRALEIGTFTGYSAVCIARGLADGGRLTCLELEQDYAATARRYLEAAGLADRVEIVVGPAQETLEALPDEPVYDLVFIDADKPSTADYVRWALKLSRPGSVVVVDNVARSGAVIDAASTDASVQGVRRLMDYLATEPRLDATAIQTVGLKGYDGFLIALVREPA